MAAAKVSDRDRGAKKLLARMREKASLTVGIHKDAGSASYDSGATIAEVASYHELGLGVPRRSFIADWADENRSKHETELRKIGRAVLKGTIKSERQGLERFGALAKAQVQQRIVSGIEPALEPETIDRKGSSTPLIDTGRLKASIDTKVESRKK